MGNKNRLRGARSGGNYTVRGLPPGKYLVKVHSRDDSNVVRSVGEVEVRPGEVTQLNIDLARSEQSR